MGKAHSFQRSTNSHNTITAPRGPAHTTGLVASSLGLVLAFLGPAPARADSSGGCLAGDWIAEATAFVAEETGVPAPDVCVSSVPPKELKVLVLPAALSRAQDETVAAVYVPATREILLADDLDLSTPLGRSCLVHELVHAQQFASRAHERASCPGVLEADAYGTQALYLRTRGLREEAFLLQVLGMFQSACGYSDY
jgi:hypothetical protein